MEPELDEHDAVLDQLLFEVVDLTVGPQPLVGRCEPFDPLDQYAAVPAPIEHREQTRTREVPPESPEMTLPSQVKLTPA
jgi:hypothetical protein